MITRTVFMLMYVSESVPSKHSIDLTKPKNSGGVRGSEHDLYTPILQMEEVSLGEIQVHSL